MDCSLTGLASTDIELIIKVIKLFSRIKGGQSLDIIKRS